MQDNSRNLKNLSVEQVADLVSEELDADVIHYDDSIERPVDYSLIKKCISRRRRKCALLMLVTNGGDASAAYRIARCLQAKYERFSLYVSGYCKSAGSLVAMGAHELIVSDHGELGPLDVQMSKKDELWGTQSGLTVMDTLTALHDNAFQAFEKSFLDIQRRSGGQITLKTAAEIATAMTTGLFAPLYSQVDPMHVGEAGRAMSIAGHYGQRLLAGAHNADQATLDFLISEYPSHGFVIDRGEIEKLFRTVREPSHIEALLADKMGERSRRPGQSRGRDGAEFDFLSTELPAAVGEATKKQAGEVSDAESGDAEGPDPSEPAEETRNKPAQRDRKEDTVTELGVGRKGRSSVRTPA